ncbi:MAG TPA: class I SAM-dependent methyltransferase [Alphaproteobacteria bacterium]
MADTQSSDYRARLLARYVSTHASVGDAATREGLERRRAYLDRLIRDHFPADRNAAIVDLGCGHGALLWAARRAGYTDVTGIDASPEQVAAARRLGIEGVRQQDLREGLAAMASGSLDVVVLFDLFHYFDRDEQVALADEVFRVLKPGGRWILHVPNGEALFGARMRYWDYLANGAFTRTSIAQILTASGFREVRSFEDAPVPHGLKSLVRWFLWKAIRGVARLVLAAETGETGRDAIFSQCLLAVAIK